MLYLATAGIAGHFIMKVKFFKRWVLETTLVILCLMGVSCPLSSPAQTQPDSAPPPADDSTASDGLPPYIYPTSPLAQVLRLTQAGVDQSIILTYVTNSSGTFNLDSDKIIYLRDVGLPTEIINAMMQRDQALQQQMTAASQPTPPPVPPPDTNPEPAPPPPADQPAPPPTEVTVNNFYDTLAPYGTWVDIDGYGRCWRPSVVVYNSGWQPYCDHGRWVYSNCGWYWSSDYSWGWAPFHYGRWFQHPHMGWCWTPDTVWGPSWVTWRYSNGFCGWAPLPPAATFRPGVGFFYRGTSVSLGFNWGLNQKCFTFVPTQFFCDPHPRRHSVAPAQVAQIFNQTTIINNFNGQGRNLANRGIDPEHISAITRTPIRPVAIRDIPSTSRSGPHGDQLSRDGGTLFVSHPTQPWSSGQNHSGPAADNRPAHPLQPQPVHSLPPNRPLQVPVVVPSHNPQDGNALHIPPQQPSRPANYNSTPTLPPSAPNHDNRTYSPRGGEQLHPPQPQRPNTYPAVTPAPNQGQSSAPAVNHNAPAAAPAPQQPQPSQPASPSASRSSNQNQNQNQGTTGNYPDHGPGYSPRH